MKFLIIDNYDSFVYNIAQRLGELGVSSDVIRNDQITINEISKKIQSCSTHGNTCCWKAE